MWTQTDACHSTDTQFIDLPLSACQRSFHVWRRCRAFIDHGVHDRRWVSTTTVDENRRQWICNGPTGVEKVRGHCEHPWRLWEYKTRWNAPHMDSNRGGQACNDIERPTMFGTTDYKRNT